MKRTITLSALAVVIITSFLACGVFPNIGGMDYMEEEVFVYSETAAASNIVPAESRSLVSRKKGNKVEDFEYAIFRVAQVTPVEVDGVPVQANDVVIHGDSAYVVYNSAGEAFRGALQVIDFSNSSRPRITTEIAFPHADLTAVAVTDTYLYIGGAWEPAATEDDRAFVARIGLDELGGLFGISLADIAERRVKLSSFVTTGIAAKGNTLFVSTGATGGELEILDSSMVPGTGTSYPDIRDIAAYHGGVIALQGTAGDDNTNTNAKVLVFKSDGSLFDQLDIADFESAEAKATIEVYDNHYAFLGLSAGGFEAVWLKDNADPGETVTSLFTEANPDVDWSSRTATNSASYSGDLAFTANGEAGFRVFRVVGDLKKDTQPAQFGELVGFVPFDNTGPDADGDFWSANHIEYRDEVLVVASGKGGVNFYTLTQK